MAETDASPAPHGSTTANDSLRTVGTVRDALVFWIAVVAAATLAIGGYLADWLNAGAALGMLLIVGALVWERGRRKGDVGKG